MFSPENLAETAFAAYSALGIVGAGGLIAIGVYWRSAGHHLNDTWGKAAVEAVQSLVLVTTIAAGYAAADQRLLWFRPAVAGAVCSVAWKFLQLLIDNRVKAADKFDKKKVAEYQRQVADFVRLLTALNAAISAKVHRATTVIGQRQGGNPLLKHVKEALDPSPQLRDLLFAVTSYFCDQLPEAERLTRRFRVGVYVSRDGVMTPAHWHNNREPGAVPFTSFKEHQERFRLDAASPAHVVQAVREQEIIVVEDCVAAEAKGTFFFFNPNQRGYLRSMVSFPLGEVCLESGKMAQGAVVIDTNADGFFKESEKEAIRFCLQQFGARIRLEMLLHALVEKKGAAHENQAKAKNKGGKASGKGG